MHRLSLSYKYIPKVIIFTVCPPRRLRIGIMETMQPLKLVSLNVALFETNNDRLERFLNKEKADILCLQEVTRKVDASTREEFISLDAVNRAAGLPYSFYAPNWIMKDFDMKDFHGQKHFRADFNGFLELGNYIKSRLPIYKGESVFLQNHYTYATDWSDWHREESRSVQIVDLDLTGGRKLRILNYHGIWSRDKKGTPQTEKACQLIRDLALEAGGPVIITGDFNLFPDTDSMRTLNDSFVSLVDKFGIATTRPATNELSVMKRNVVDYVFLSRDIRPLAFEVPQSDVSDHLPLILTFTLD